MRAKPSRGWQCPDCGFIQHGGAPDDHSCDERTFARFQAARFEPAFREWLESPAGLFEVFYWRRVG